jgi:hypothetical protein
MAPTVEIEHIEALRTIVSNKVSPGEAHRVMKIWRAFWKVMAAMRLCEKDADPSLVLRNSAPKGRSATWAEWEIARIAKQAWRDGYRGLDTYLPKRAATVRLADVARRRGRRVLSENE